MTKRYGKDAVVQAAQRAEAALDEGDIDGGALWMAIMHAIEELQRAEPAPGERLN